MKPIEFVRKYDLQSGWKPRVQNSFLQDMTNELLAFCEVNQANDNIKAFNNAIKVVRMKWDAVSRKIAGGLPEKLWNYWWATVVVKIRAELCPTEERRRAARQAARQAEYEERKAQEERERAYWRNIEQETFWERIFLMASLLAGTRIPEESFQYLQISSSSTPEQVLKRYRELALIMHPDKGGNQEEFITLTEHKNKAYQYAMENNRSVEK